MPFPRDFHTATLLPNGKVLVAGGSYFGGSFNTCEHYDPTTGMWSPTGALADERHGHSATLLPNGKVLVVGKDSMLWSAACSTELYDPDSGTWTMTSSLAEGRGNHTATLMHNGRVLVAGGYSLGFLGSAETYDPDSGAWTTTGSLAEGRTYPTATLMSDGRVFVAGGEGVARAEIWEPRPGIGLGTSSLRQNSRRGQNAASQTFEAWNAGPGTLDYTINCSDAWLSITPTSGIFTGQHSIITANYAISSLSPGTYTATITITPGGSGNPANVEVRLTVDGNMPWLGLLMDE
jgi:hypothetical protein